MVSQNQTTQIRIKFKKYGSLIYISHLDLARTMQRIMVRSGIDIWYSEGFNPQPKIVFAVPLPVGVESECEYMDIKINSTMECEEIKHRLANNLPKEMEIIDVYFPESKLKNVVYIDHEIKIHSAAITKDTPKQIESLFENDVFVMKFSKGNEKQINVKEYIYSLNATLVGDDLLINAILCAGSDKNLNPELLIDAIRKNTKILNGSPIEEYYSIRRKDMLTCDLKSFS